MEGMETVEEQTSMQEDKSMQGNKHSNNNTNREDDPEDMSRLTSLERSIQTTQKNSGESNIQEERGNLLTHKLKAE